MPRLPTIVNSEEHDLIRYNLRAETFFSGFNGVFLALAIFVSPVVAVTSFEATPLELTILVSAFPVGAFLGPVWAFLGRHWGMQKLVTQMALWANIPLFFVFFLDRQTDSAYFTALITLSQLFNSAMRMGQSSMYRVMYPRELRGFVLGRLTFWSYLTMVPSILATGWLLDKSLAMYQILYPLAGMCGLVSCLYYSMLHVPPHKVPRPSSANWRESLRGVQHILSQDRAYFLFQFAFFLSGSAFFMSTHIILLLTHKRFGFSAFELSLWMSVMPQLLLTLASPAWGKILDRHGIVHCRLIISFLMIAYLGSYLFGVVSGVAWFIYLGSILQGLANSGGQLTWLLASSHFAPRIEDVPLYNGIHFVLNGIRGLVAPWLGSILLVTAGGPWAIFASVLLTAASVPVIMRGLRLDDERDEPVLRVVPAKDEPGPAEKSAG